jgi:hypothetical protein
MQLFIPRVGVNVDFDIMYDVFRDLKIGIVTHADFHHKKTYQYVFVNIIPFLESSLAILFEERMQMEGKLTIQFPLQSQKMAWEIKSHISLEERKRLKEEEQYPDIVLSVYNHVFT